MVRVKDIIISESAPNDPKVGWITISNGKPVLRFNTGSGNKLVQFTFVKTSEGIAYEVYVSKLGEDF